MVTWFWVLGVVAGGLLVARIARQWGASRLAAMGAAVLFVAAGASRSVAFEPARPIFLVTTLVLLVVVERWGALRRRPQLAMGIVAAAAVALFVVALRGAAIVPGSGAPRLEPAIAPLALESAQRGFGLVTPLPFLTAWPLALVPVAFLLPLVAAIALLAARVLRGAALAAALLVAGLQSYVEHGDRAEVARLERALPHAAAAWRLAELTRSPAPIEIALASERSAALPAGCRERLALQVVALRVDADDRAGALAFLDRWLGGHDERGSFPEARARRVALVLAERGMEAAAAQLTRDLDRHGRDPRFVAPLAGVLVDVLQRSAQEPAAVATLLPLSGRLLEEAAARPEQATADELLSLALLKAGESRYVEAVRLAELAIQRDPKSARPHVVLARLYLGLGEREAGLREVALARRIAPRDAAALLLEGRLLCGSRDLARRGVERMLEALAAEPDLPGIHAEIDDGVAAAAAALLGAGEADAAQAQVERAAARIGRRPGIAQAQGRLAMHRRDFAAAIAHFDEAFAAAPERGELRRELAEALRDAGYERLLAGDRPLALGRFERAIAVAPAGFDVDGMRAVVESARPPDDEERRRIEAARAASDEASKLYAAGDKAGAKAALERSIEILPLNPLAHLNLGRIELELGGPKEAEGHLRTAIAAGDAKAIDVEEAWSWLLQALAAQDAGEAKLRAVVADYLERYPAGRYREAFAKLAH